MNNPNNEVLTDRIENHSVLDQIQSEMEELAGAWNGEDDKFTCGGEVYTEEDAHIANEIAEDIKKGKELIKTAMNNYKRLHE